MKNILLTCLLFLAVPLLSYSQDLNLGDFEDMSISGWYGWDALAPVSVEANPAPDATNPSDYVALLDQSALNWKGIATWHDNPILDPDFVKITLDVYLNQAGLIQIYMDNPVSSGAAAYTHQVTGIAAKTWTSIEFDLTGLPAYDYKQIAFQSDIQDSIFFDNITMVYGGVELIPGMITRETFGTKDYGTNNTRVQPTGWFSGSSYHWDWWEVDDFSSTNGHIESGSDSSIRIVAYAGWPAPPEWPDPSLAQHLLIVNRDAYLGSWDTVVFKDINIAKTVVTSVEFAFGKNSNFFINPDTAALNVEYRIDGGDWIQMDTSLIDTLSPIRWDYTVLPIDSATGSTMDVRLAALNQTQVFIDDLSVFGLVQPVQGTNDFPIANVVVGSVDSPADFTGNLHASWDADSLYLNFTITDDSIVNSGTAYQVDNIEVYLDLDNSKNVHYPRNGGWVMAVDAAYDDNDFQLRLVPGVDFATNNGTRPSIVNLGGVKQVYAENDTGYTFVLNIAWDSLWVGFEPAVDSMLGLDALVSDNDAVASDANRNQITMNSPTDKPFNDPSLFATLQYKADGRFMLIPDEEPPTAPPNLSGTSEGTTVTLSWDLASDNIAVMKYRVVTGSQTIEVFAEADGNSIDIPDQPVGTNNYLVRSVDNYGNLSPYASTNVVVSEVGIHNDLEQEFTVFPNPASSMLTINGVQGIQKIQIIAITGNIVLNVMNTNVIDLSSLSQGLYFIKVQTQDNLYSTTFVKE
jgi:hypothetical protein